MVVMWVTPIRKAEVRQTASPVTQLMDGCFLLNMEKRILKQDFRAGQYSDGFYSTTWLVFLIWHVGFVLNSSFDSYDGFSTVISSFPGP